MINLISGRLCDYSDACLPVKGKTTITGAGDDSAAIQADEINKGVIFNNCAPFINCKSEINSIEIDHAKGIDIVMPMYNLIVVIIQKHLEVYDNITKMSQMITQQILNY